MGTHSWHLSQEALLGNIQKAIIIREHYEFKNCLTKKTIKKCEVIDWKQLYAKSTLERTIGKP